MNATPQLLCTEVVRGHYAPGLWNPSRGYQIGMVHRIPLYAELTSSVADVGRFLGDPEVHGGLVGTVTAGLLGEDLPIEEGRFNHARLLPMRGCRLTYEGALRAGGERYHFLAYREILLEEALPSAANAATDMTTFHALIRRGGSDGPLFGAGIMHFNLRDLPDVLRTIRTPGLRGDPRLALIGNYLRELYGDIVEAFLIGLVTLERCDAGHG